MRRDVKMMAIGIASSIDGLSVEGNDAVRRSYCGQTCMSKGQRKADVVVGVCVMILLCITPDYGKAGKVYTGVFPCWFVFFVQ